MSPDISRLDQYRSELRDTINAGVYGHEASFADGIDPSLAFQGCVDMLHKAAVENAQGDPGWAVRHVAGLASEAMLMLALGEQRALPGLSPEERMASSEEAVQRQAREFDEAFEQASAKTTRMLALYHTSKMRENTPKKAWDLFRAYVAEESRMMVKDGVPGEVIADRLAGLVAYALVVAVRGNHDG